MQERNEIWEIELRSGPYLLGEEKGLARGREEGRRTTLIELLVTVLEVRGVHLDANSEARVRACEDLQTLERWARRAREVEAASELFRAG